MTRSSSPAPTADDSGDRPRPDSESGQPFDVVRAQHGDTDAFARVVRAHEAGLLTLAYRITGDREDARDVLQDSLALAWRRLPQLERPMAFRAWMNQVVTRQGLRFVRRRDHGRASLEPDLAPGREDMDPVRFAEAVAQGKRLDEALATLPSELRLCWVLRDLHGLSYAEIAHAVGEPVATVRGRIARARPRLAEELGDWR